jgi:sugar lactone lactonase YvrE
MTRSFLLAVLLFACLLPVEKRGWCAAAPLIPRSEMLTVDELRPGMKGVGKTVFQGTKIESFGVTIVGVLRRVDFDGDIILVRITSGPPVSKGYGVIAGMSGSPIYVNGKIIGALAYAWSFAKTPIAGVTPIEQMLEAFQPGSSPARRHGALRAPQPFTLDGQRIERAVVVPSAPEARSTSAGTMALVPIATPVLVTGLGPRMIADLRKALEPLGLMPMAGAGAAGHIDAKMAPGQAVGARLVGGDLDITAVGTITYVKGDTVLAFGHPMAGLGATDLPLVAAYVHGVLPSLDISFKLASGGQTLGHFTEDRPWCIGGRLGEQPDLIGTSLKITDRDRGVARDYRVEVIRDRSLTSMLLVAVLGGAIQSLGPPAEGTTRAHLVVEAKGLPKLERENTYTVEGGGGILALLLGAFGGAESAEGELSQILDVLRNSEFGEARVGRVSVEVEFTKVIRYARIEDAYIATPKVRAGDSVPVALTIRTSDGGLVYRTETVQIPADCPPGRVRIGVAGGRSAERSRARLEISEPKPVSLTQMIQQMLRRPGNDELVVDLALPTVGIEARGFAFRDLPPAAIDLLRSATANRPRALRDYSEQRTKTEWVISGSVVLTLTVEGDEKDKTGRPPSPQYEPPRYEQISGGFGGLFFGPDFESTGAGSTNKSCDEGAQVDMESPPEMPSWEAVASVSEMEIAAPGAAEETKPAAAARGEAIGRLASVWRLTDPKELPQGKVEGVALLSTGGIALAPRPQQLAQIEARCLWPVAVAPDASVYTGTWTDGRLRKTAPDGTTAVVLDTESAGVQAVAADAKGTIYAATVPGGAIYRVLPGGASEKLCELGVQNVWALAVTGDGSLWAATGPGGKLFRISSDGRASAAFTAADRHITCLAVGPQDTIYLGTSPLGKVYAVSPDGSARALAELNKAAVQSIAVDASGVIYLGTSPDARVFRLSQSGAMDEMLRVKARHILGLLVQPDGVVLAAAGPEARVMAIYPDKRSALVYDSKATYIAALTRDTAGDVYLTVADAGRLVKLEYEGARVGSYTSPARDGGASTRWGAVRWSGPIPGGAEVALYTRTGATSRPDRTWSDWQQVTLAPGSSVPSPVARFLQCRVDLKATGPEAPQLEALEVSYLPVNRAPEVTLTSPAGAEIWAGKQTIRWRGRDPDGDKLEYDVYWSSDRGKTWTKIEAPKEETGEAKKQVGADIQPKAARPGRAEGATAPSARLEKPAPAPEHPSGKPQQPLRDLEVLPTTAVPLQDDAPDIEGEIMRALEAGPGDEAAQEDMAEPSGEGEEAPARPAAGGFGATSLKWDTAKVPDGVYWLRVVGSDARANPGDAQAGQALSRPFTVDNTPPELIVDGSRKDDDAPPPSVTAFDRASYLTSAEFKVDTGDWLAAIPQDGVFDGQYEGLLLDAARLPDGSHQVEVRARDAAGNLASKTLRYKK